MNLYIVRHGESTENARGYHQDHTARLSEEGMAHAAAYAERLKNIRIDSIIASPFTRTTQTAEVISAAIGVPVEFSPLFVEIKRPTAIEGKSMKDPEVIGIKKAMDERFHDPSHRHSDEETFFDLKARAEKGLAFVDALEDENVLLVTHGDFMKMFVAVILFGEQLHPLPFLTMKPHLKTSHTGITLCKRDEKGWCMESWNSF